MDPVVLKAAGGDAGGIIFGAGVPPDRDGPVARSSSSRRALPGSAAPSLVAFSTALALSASRTSAFFPGAFLATENASSADADAAPPSLGLVNFQLRTTLSERPLDDEPAFQRRTLGELRLVAGPESGLVVIDDLRDLSLVKRALDTDPADVDTGRAMDRYGQHSTDAQDTTNKTESTHAFLPGL
jgi:hypothetical protein